MAELLETVETIILNKPRKYSLFILLYIVLGFSIIAYLFFETNNIAILFCGFLAISFSPLIFQKQFRRGFSQKATVKFFNDSISLVLKDISTDRFITEDTHRFDEIKAIKAVKGFRNDFTNLKLLLKNHSQKIYTFSNQYSSDKTPNIHFLIRKYVREYNLSKAMEDKIIFISNFYATKKSLFVIIPLIIGALGVLIYLIIKAPITIPALIIPFFLIYVEISTQRKIDIRDSQN